MNVVDLLITIVVVTILVTIVLAVVTYVAYKLRLAREPGGDETGSDEPRYFVRYPPPPEEEAESHARATGPGERSPPTEAGPRPDAPGGRPGSNGTEDGPAP